MVVNQKVAAVRMVRSFGFCVLKAELIGFADGLDEKFEQNRSETRV